MIEDLMNVLNSFEVPVYRQGSMSADAKYPDIFITWWNNDTPDHAHYDNARYGTVWDFNVYVYSNRISRTYSMIESIRAKLEEHGWVAESGGFDAASDEPTHAGRGIEVLYLQS